MQLAKPDPVLRSVHAGGERLLPGLERQVQVIGHQTEGVHAVAEARHAFGQEFIEAMSILRGEEDGLAGVAAQDHVVEAAGDVQTGFAGHAMRIVERSQLCN